MILVCKGICAPVVPPFEGQRRRFPRNAAPFRRPCSHLNACWQLRSRKSGCRYVYCCSHSLIVTTAAPGPAISRCSCIGPSASGRPAPWCLIFLRGTRFCQILRSRIVGLVH